MIFYSILYHQQKLSSLQPFNSAMLTSNHTHFHFSDHTYSKDRDFSESELFPNSEKSLPQSSRFNGSNKYCEQYSFNKHQSFSNNQSESQMNEPLVYEASDPLQGQYSSNRNAELIRKYESIYNKLKQLQSIDIICLFLEEIEQNQKCRQKIQQESKHSKGLEEEMCEFRVLLEKKRQAIRKLCETQSNNLNLIECLQQQSKKDFNWNEHFMVKYKELQSYMNEYISNTQEAQEEFSRSYTLLRKECQRFAHINDQLQRDNIQYARQLQLTQLRQTKSHQCVNAFKEKERALMIQLEQLQEENCSLHKQLKELAESAKENEQFEIELAKENKELSSELDFIRQKMSDNSSSQSRDIFEKIEADLSQKLKKQKEELEMLLSNQKVTSELALREKHKISYSYEKIVQQMKQKDALIYELQKELRALKPLSEVSSNRQNNKSNDSFESSSKPSLHRNCREVYQYDNLF